MKEYTEEYIRSLGAFGYDTDALMREWKVTGHIKCLERNTNLDNEKELEHLINLLHEVYPEVSYAKLTRICVRVARWQRDYLKRNINGIK